MSDTVHFVIPTYRLKDVGETVRLYDENFRHNGHEVRMVVFDDSSVGAHETYFSSLQGVKTHFDYEGEVTHVDCEEILARVRRVHDRVTAEAGATRNPERGRALAQFATTLDRAFYGFEPDFFQQNVARIVDDVVNQIKACIDLWPRLVEICYFQKSRAGLPATRIGRL